MANSSATADSSARPVPEGFVRLVSADNYEFLVEEESVSVSKVIKKLLEVDFKESRTREIKFPETDGDVLEVTCQYLYYLRRNRSIKACAKEKDNRAQETFEIPAELNVKVLLFASLLDL